MRAKLLAMSAVIMGLLLAPAAAKADVKVGGLIHYDYYSSDDNSATTADSSFIWRRARLAASGSVVKDLVGFHLMLAADAGADDSTASGTTTGSTVSVGGNDAKLVQGWMDLKFHPMASVRAGSWKLPFGMSTPESGSMILMSIYPEGTAKLIGSLGAGAFRAQGVQLMGKMKGPVGFGYQLAYVNGKGNITPDNNTDKGYALNAWVDPVKGLKIGGSYAATDLLKEGSSGTDQASGYAAYLQYEQGPIHVRGEYQKVEVDKGSDKVTNPNTYYVQAGYKVTPAIVVKVRHQKYDTDVTDSDFTSNDIGVDYNFKGKGFAGGTKVALDYMMRDAGSAYTAKQWGERGASVKGNKVDNLLVLRFQVAF